MAILTSPLGHAIFIECHRHVHHQKTADDSPVENYKGNVMSAFPEG
jgi:hypothetical protein